MVRSGLEGNEITDYFEVFSGHIFSEIAGGFFAAIEISRDLVGNHENRSKEENRSRCMTSPVQSAITD